MRTRRVATYGVSVDDTPIAVDLQPVEREMLATGLIEWGGPAHCTDALAIAMGFASCADIEAQGSYLIPLLRRGSALTPSEWTRTLLATEIVWASDVVGAGSDASILFGRSDVEAIGTLRSVQRKLLDAGVVRIPPR
jgi:hypothetical protein